MGLDGAVLHQHGVQGVVFIPCHWAACRASADAHRFVMDCLAGGRQSRQRCHRRASEDSCEGIQPARYPPCTHDRAVSTVPVFLPATWALLVGRGLTSVATDCGCCCLRQGARTVRVDLLLRRLHEGGCYAQERTYSGRAENHSKYGVHQGLYHKRDGQSPVASTAARLCQVLNV